MAIRKLQMQFANSLDKVKKAFNLAGGMIYHYHAVKFKATFWQSYLQHVQKFLDSWEPKNEQLLLIGPSGGYSLPEKLVARYQRLVAVDIDPIAEAIFKNRFPGSNVLWINEDVFKLDRGLQVDSFREFLRKFSNSDILFCNVLGQLPIYYKISAADEYALWLKDLFGLIKDYNYASYHDIFSFKGNAKVKSEFENFDNQITPESLALRFLETPPAEMQDHFVSSLFAERSRMVIYWQLNKDSHHFIECVKSVTEGRS